MNAWTKALRVKQGRPVTYDRSHVHCNSLLLLLLSSHMPCSPRPTQSFSNAATWLALHHSCVPLPNFVQSMYGAKVSLGNETNYHPWMWLTARRLPSISW